MAYLANGYVMTILCESLKEKLNNTNWLIVNIHAKSSTYTGVNILLQFLH